VITARSAHTATLIQDGTALIVGGLASGVGGILTSAESYDPTSGVFSATSYTLNTARYGHTATLLPNGYVVIIGGSSTDDAYSDVLNTAEIYTPGSGFAPMSVTLNTARMYHTATLLSGGNVLVADGKNSSGASLRDIELCNNAACTDLGNILIEAKRHLYADVCLSQWLHTNGHGEL
jgi:hypothetical protein